jgi:hypothetical protein
MGYLASLAATLAAVVALVNAIPSVSTRQSTDRLVFAHFMVIRLRFIFLISSIVIDGYRVGLTNNDGPRAGGECCWMEQLDWYY